MEEQKIIPSPLTLPNVLTMLASFISIYAFLKDITMTLALILFAAGLLAIYEIKINKNKDGIAPTHIQNSMTRVTTFWLELKAYLSFSLFLITRYGFLIAFVIDTSTLTVRLVIGLLIISALITEINYLHDKKDKIFSKNTPK